MNHRDDRPRPPRVHRHVIATSLATAIGDSLPPVAVTDSSVPNTALAQLQIAAVLDRGSHALDSTTPTGTGLSDTLRVRVGLAEQLDAFPAFDASPYVLFLSGQEVKRLEVSTYDRAGHSLLLKLTRNSANNDFYKGILSFASKRMPL